MKRPRSTAISQHRRRSAGFTLVEMIVATGLIGLLAATATWYWVDVSNLSRAVTSDNAAVNEARSALERLAKEIREVKYITNPSTGSPRYCVDGGAGNMAAGKFVFYKHSTSGTLNYTACGTVSAPQNDTAVTIQYSDSTDTLSLCYACTEALPTTSPTLLSSVTAFSMSYLPAVGTTPVTSANLTPLRFVEISLTVSPTGSPPTSMKTLVALRNL